MKTIARALVALFIILALGASVETHPPLAQADSVGAQTFVTQSSAGNLTTNAYVSVDRAGEYLYTTYKDYSAGGSTYTYGVNPAGGQAGLYQTTSGTHAPGHNVGVWTCLNNPTTGTHICNSQIVLTTGGTCYGCASYNTEGQIWDDHAARPPIVSRLTQRIGGTQWNGSQWFVRPQKGIGGGGGSCTCSWPFSVTYVNGQPYCYTPVPPFTYSYYPCN